MSTSFSSKYRSQGFTLIELLVVISIIAILAGMLLPVIGVVREMARKAQCGKNQSQILGAMVAYGTSEGTAWPDPRGGTKFTGTAAIGSGEAAAEFTACAFELLSASQSLPDALFKCPSAPGGGPNKALRASSRRAFVDATWGWTGVNKVSYAFDWASPADPGSARVILSDRDLKNHKDIVVACFGDAHVSDLKADKTATPGAGGTTKGVITDPSRSVFNPAAKGAWNEEDDDATQTKDDIWTPAGDAENPEDCLKPGGGHAIRSYVK